MAAAPVSGGPVPHTSTKSKSNFPWKRMQGKFFLTNWMFLLMKTPEGRKGIFEDLTQRSSLGARGGDTEMKLLPFLTGVREEMELPKLPWSGK